MSDREWKRVFNHPYQQNKNAAATDAHLLATTVKVPPYSPFTVPFTVPFAYAHGKSGRTRAYYA